MPISFESSSCEDGQKDSTQNVMVRVVVANRSPHTKEEAPLWGIFLRRAWRNKPDLGSDSRHKNFNNELFKTSKTKSQKKKKPQNKILSFVCKSEPPHSSADCLGPSPQGLLLWEVQPARRRTAWVPSSCRVRGECPPSCHPGSREERVLACVMAQSPSQQHQYCPCAGPGSLGSPSSLLMRLWERRGACRRRM